MFDQILTVFPGIGTLFVQEPVIAISRLGLMGLGFFLAYLGFKRTLEPLIMVPMGLGMMAVNAGVMFLEAGQIGTLIIAPMVSDTEGLINILQIDFLQPVYNFTFTNSLVACLLFMGIGTMADISFILARPWASMTVALFAELGTFATLVIGYYCGLTPGQAAAVGSIGGADGPMVLFASLVMAKDLFVPISIIAYLYLSLCYAGYPYLVKWLIPEKYRGLEVEFEFPDVSQEAKFVFTIVAAGLLCFLLPVAAPLILSFFLGVAIKEAEIEPYQQLLEKTITYGATLFLGLVLGVLCEASTLLDPRVAILLVLGITALAISGLGGIAGGWFMWWWSKGKFNPVIGIAGVSCMPSTAKIAQQIAFEASPYAMIMPLAMGAQICGVIVSAIAVGVFASTIGLVGG
ncbi:Na+-transporting methylmalonyl-CoA/oxaloacetate decarboxylase, subunit beta [Rhodospirillum rubrum F11]|uniref:Carboxybiotin decarboxylase n=1 Tax=Rhodospirillum rubrum (strain ATCC 11170 / ATH 1.1.1 / DSM 467 / LMG 4362 / NCIMB 8255 / S1) TaxID=269796 RepID=Q2RUS4_RHORT|nr:Na+-transporting malonate decarboxylase, carboxybiotin decarboxylase subunit [Rhodospirillum rubrum]ABC22121.1 Na+-transporting methylmalonyl-CoA/oxaloacetate decarboxylase, beta subunit [Rhodospirillum rubrum ATCC 11170]AEO47836.1 Na+-transporting methylmalonyl-CoA/oxaloacetate decarboxylase, subunit beta [Rhodospirillum rubrum F11]MBK5953710.1 Na+-transporting malonate decarboxylase, carboxybiotin decarboxylase subunit [Rhodospirillum rubrum]QXG81770.1 Na+-transporting malonate decarboxyla